MHKEAAKASAEEEHQHESKINISVPPLHGSIGRQHHNLGTVVVLNNNNTNRNSVHRDFPLTTSQLRTAPAENRSDPSIHLLNNRPTTSHPQHSNSANSVLQIIHPGFLCLHHRHHKYGTSARNRRKMKFIGLALSALVYASRVTEVMAERASIKPAATLRKGDIDQLLSSMDVSNVRAFNDAVMIRDLEQSGAGYYNRYYYEIAQNRESSTFPITGNYTVKFDQCLSLAVGDASLLNEEYIGYAQDGTIRAEQSFVMFGICQSDNCEFDDDNESTNFIVPLESFVMSLLQYEPNKRSQYCEACQQEYSYCKNGQGKNYDDIDPDDPTFFYYHGTRYELINCQRCDEYNCYSDNANGNANGQFASENEEFWYYMSQWMQNIASCSSIDNAQWNNLNLYAGMVCSEDGSGIDVGVFVDDNCRIRNTAIPYTTAIKNEDEYIFYYKTGEVTDVVFNGAVDCNGESIQYVNAYQPVYAEDGSSYGDNACEKDEDGNVNNEYLCSQYQSMSNKQATTTDRRANQACQTLFGTYGYSYAMSMKTCREKATSSDRQTWSSTNPKDWRNSGLYEYDLTAEQVLNMNIVCEEVSQGYKKGAYATGQGSRYNSDGSRKSIFPHLSQGGMILTIALVTVIAAAAMAVFIRLRIRKQQEGDAVFPEAGNGASGKKLPLMT